MGALRFEGLSEKGIFRSMIDFFVESGREESGVFGFATHGTKQGTGGRPVKGGIPYAEGGITLNTFAGVPDGDWAGIVFIRLHMAGVLWEGDFGPPSRVKH
jgi:hypothetical protein